MSAASLLSILLLLPPQESPAAAERRQKCGAGDADACHGLGVDHEYGHGVPKDEAKAAALYRQACQAGHAGGCDSLGELYEEGKGVPVDPAQAIVFYRRACQGGLPLGCQHLRQIPGGDKDAQPPPPRFDGLYRGEIGGRKVLVLIEGTDADPDFWGRYAYLHVGLPIGLEGKLTESAAVIGETRQRDADEQAASGAWSGTFSTSGFNGEWKSPNGARRYPIALALERKPPARDSGAESDPARPSLEDAFNDELARLNLIPQKGEVSAGDTAYGMVRQTRAGVAYPRLTRHPDPAVLGRVNADLEKRHIASASAALACAPTACRSCEYEEQLAVELFSPEFLSLSVGGVGSCGGPGLFDWRDAATYDLKAGAPIDLSKEFAVVAPEGALNEAFLPLFLKHVAAADPDPDRLEQVRECHDDESGGVGYRVVLALTAGGLKVATDWARHIEAPCEADVTIPYAEMARFRSKDSRYRFGAERH